jgi:hypothetical protein
MRTLSSDVTRLFVVVVFLSAISLGNAASNPSGRLIVIRVANFGWNVVANLNIDGRTAANIVQGRKYDHPIVAGQHVLTISAVPNVINSQSSSITINVRPGGTYIFTAMWDSYHVYLQPTNLSPADMVRLGL